MIGLPVLALWQRFIAPHIPDRPKTTAEASHLMLVEACRGLDAGHKLEALFSEATASPDVTPEMLEEYGRRLSRLAWDMQRGVKQ